MFFVVSLFEGGLPVFCWHDLFVGLKFLDVGGESFWVGVVQSWSIRLGISWGLGAITDLGRQGCCVGGQIPNDSARVCRSCMGELRPLPWHLVALQFLGMPCCKRGFLIRI